MLCPIPIHISRYTDACERLHRTNMHSINEEHLMEFALAVHVVYGNFYTELGHLSRISQRSATPQPRTAG